MALKFGSKSGTGFVAPTKSITQGTAGHRSALKQPWQPPQIDLTKQATTTSKPTERTFTHTDPAFDPNMPDEDFNKLSKREQKSYKTEVLVFKDQQQEDAVTARQKQLTGSGYEKTKLEKETQKYTQGKDETDQEFKERQQEEIERKGKITTDVATRKEARETDKYGREVAQDIGTAEAQRLQKIEDEKQKKIMGGKYAQEAAEKKAKKTETKVGERRGELDKDIKERTGKKREKFGDKVVNQMNKVGTWEDKQKGFEEGSKQWNNLQKKIDKGNQKIEKFEGKEETVTAKGGIFKRMSTKIAENKADEAQRMLDPVYRQQKEARDRAKAADIFQAMVSPEAKRAGSYQQDLATQEMEAARLKQQKSQSEKKEAIHLPKQESTADIYRYDVGAETEEG